MNALQSNMRTWLLWLLPFAALGAVIGWQTDWGRGWTRVPPPQNVVVPQPVAAVVLPEYRPQATPDTHRDIVERSLFNPTRRPAPAAVAEVAKPKLQRGQFALSGTLMVDGKATAFLRENAGGRSRRVAQGETINGMVVSEVRTDRVRLTLGDESEELALKVAVGPRTTIQPVVAAAAPSGSGAAMGGPGGPGGPRGAGGTPTATSARPPSPQDVSSILAERRRAAREAEAAAAMRNTGSAGVPQATPPTVSSTRPDPAAAAANAAPATVDPQWNSVFQRYQQPRR